MKIILPALELKALNYRNNSLDVREKSFLIATFDSKLSKCCDFENNILFVISTKVRSFVATVSL